MKARLAVIILIVLPLLAAGVLTLDQCSRTRVPRSGGEAVLYSAWQKLRYGDQIDRFTPPENNDHEQQQD